MSLCGKTMLRFCCLVLSVTAFRTQDTHTPLFLLVPFIFLSVYGFILYLHGNINFLKLKKNKEKSKDKVGCGQVVTGRLELARSGTGFVIAEGRDKDVLIKADNLKTALNGDTVRAEIFPNHKAGKRPEGAIREVVQRKQTEFIGTVHINKQAAFLIPDKENMPVDIYIPLPLLHDAQNGDKAIARMLGWPEKAKNPSGEIIAVLTGQPANEIAMQEILTDNGFPLHFPNEVLAETTHISDVMAQDEIARRMDFRKTLTMTIDPADAKDFDDAISIKTLRSGYYEVGIHIADVSFYVRPDTALDKEAYRRATSVYLPDRVLPMLPERLSNELCSLRPDEDKYVFSAVFQINKAGKIKDYKLGKGIIRSARRFTYDEVQEIIEGAAGDHREEILVLNEIAQHLRAARFAHGAINFSSQEVRFKLDEKGMPVAIIVKESKEAHKLIEELMLLANRTVAEYVAAQRYQEQPIPFPYRVHDVPNEDKLKIFSLFAARFGHKFDLNTPAKIAASFNDMLELVKGKPEQHVLESLGIRTMSKAVYTTQNIGHYGLGFADYCHFTSPIRRYPDVLVHRILAACLEQNIHPAKQAEQQCRHCSDMERRAMDAERSGNKYKQVEFMQQFVGAVFDAVISGVAGFGFWAETVEQKCEGMVSITDLGNIDEFELIEEEYALVGRHSGLKLRIGDWVKVRVAAANLAKKQIDYSLEEMPVHTGISGKKKPKSKTNLAEKHRKKK
jgi:ribonuclease R